MMKQSHTDFVITVYWITGYDPCGRNEYDYFVERFPVAQEGAARLLWEDIVKTRRLRSHNISRGSFIKVTKETEELGKF